MPITGHPAAVLQLRRLLHARRAGWPSGCWFGSSAEGRGGRTGTASRSSDRAIAREPLAASSIPCPVPVTSGHIDPYGLVPEGKEAAAATTGAARDSRRTPGRSARRAGTRTSARSSFATSTSARTATTTAASARPTTAASSSTRARSEELELDIRSTDPLGFPEYPARLKKAHDERRRRRCAPRRRRHARRRSRSTSASWTSRSWAARWAPWSARRSRGSASARSSGSTR